MAHHMQERYQTGVVPALMKEFELRQPHAGAAHQKVVVNIGVGEALDNAKALDAAVARPDA